MNGSGREVVARVLLVLALLGAVVMLFERPFAVAPPAFVAALVGAAISSKNRRFGIATTMIVTVCFVIGASAAVWSSRALY